MQDNRLKKISQLIDEVEKVIYGKREVIQLTVTALLAGGHVLFEDVPGVGKTLLVKTLAKSMNASFSRVQFTPDLLPSDILGVSVFNTQTQSFEFHKGPIFTTILLADEINRTTPKSQAALLEAMSEYKVTIDNHSYPLSKHFFVLATQNPIDYEGTYPLPEAQLDRFLFRLKIGYPSYIDELALMKQSQVDESVVSAVMSEKELEDLKNLVEEVYVDELIVRYALDLVQASRDHANVRLGISPRTRVSFIRAAKAYALTQGRMYVIPEDIQQIMPAVFGHRLLIRGGSQQLLSIITQIKEAVKVPVVLRR